MTFLKTLIIAFLCSHNASAQPTIIDLANDISITDKQQLISKFYQQASGKLIIYYSFGSLVMEHQPKLQLLTIKVEVELSEEVAEPEEVSCPLNTAKEIDWIYLNTNTIRDNPPNKSLLLQVGCRLDSLEQ